MTEQEARQVLLLQSHEAPAGAADGALSAMSSLMQGHAALPGSRPGQAPGSPLWSAEDRGWATRQAVAAVGDGAGPRRFVAARAAIALQRLLPRDPSGQRWLGRRAWHPAWVAVALVLGFLAGLAADQLGPPQRVNLLAPAVWAVVAWNLAVYTALLLPSGLSDSLPSLRDALSRWALRGPDTVALLWARHAAPLTGARLALLLHTAAAGLGLGLVVGLYLRGLVLDYRAGWQSTFLDAATVQQALGWLLKPASMLTGIAVPDVAPLRVAPGADATATAAPWIHLLASTLALAVLAPRVLLAFGASARARNLARHFPLALDTPYFESLHPLMRPGLTPTVRVLWVPLADAGPQALRLFDVEVTSPQAPLSAPLSAPLTLVRSDEGDALQLHPVPPGVQGAVTPAAAPTPWWQRWRTPGPTPVQRLRERTDVALLLTRPGQALPGWLDDLARPLVVLVDAAEAEPPRLSLHDRADGWLAEGRLLLALEAALPDDPRLARLRQAWVAQQSARLDAGVQVLAESLARIATTHQPVADEGFLARRAEAEAARAALAGALDAQWLRFEEALSERLGPAASGDADAAGNAVAMPGPLHPGAQVRGRVGEGRAALMGGVLTGALAGLKADVLSGGLTMGAGAIAGGLLGALGAAGVAKGLNVVRGTDRSFASWDEDALAPIAQALLHRYLVRAHGLAPTAAEAALMPVLARQHGALAVLWRSRERRLDNPGEAEQLARTLHPLLRETVVAALGGPARP